MVVCAVTSWVKTLVKLFPQQITFLFIILKHAFLPRVDHGNSVVTTKPELEGNPECDYPGYSGYLDFSATEVEYLDLAQNQGKPRMHLTLP